MIKSYGFVTEQWLRGLLQRTQINCRQSEGSTFQFHCSTV